MIRQLAHIDDFIAYQAGSHIITLRWTNHAVYTVTVQNGELTLHELGGAYSSETEARLIARGYAQMFKAEHEARTPATLDAYRQATTQTGRPNTEPMDRVLASATSDGYIPRGREATSTQLIALKRRGLVELHYGRRGNQRVILGARLTRKRTAVVA